MTESMMHTVTGATGYTGRYITELLLQEGHRVQSITGHPDRHNPFGESVELHPFNFDEPNLLKQTLAGTDTLFNTYWIRFNRGGRTYEQCVQHTRTMFKAAKAAGVRRVVHISITNPDIDSPLPYFRGKAQIEDALRRSGLSYAILRPTVLYSTEDILLNNIAWTVRTFPFVLMPGSGQCKVQPVLVDDLAQLAVKVSRDNRNSEIDAVGPEVFTYRQMVELIRDKVGARCLVLPAPRLLAFVAAEILGLFLNDVVITRDEIKGLCANLMVSNSASQSPTNTKLSEWLDRNGHELGLRYASEIRRHY